MYFEKMIGEKCYLSPIDIDDAPKYAEWLNSEEVFRFLLAGPNVISQESEDEIYMDIVKEDFYD